MANSDIRIGRVSDVNYEDGMLRVTYRDKDESVTSDFPMLTNNDEYRMPQVGQHVIVAHLSNGSSRGVVIGTIWNAKNVPNETGETLYRKDFSREKNAAYERYSDDTGEYLLKVANIHLNGVNKALLDAPEVEIAANIFILVQTEKLEVKAGTGMHIEAAEEIEAVSGADMKLSGENVGISAGEEVKLTGDGSVEIGTGGTLRLRDGEYDTTLKEIMERLDALGG